jgi:hypothetical protein
MPETPLDITRALLDATAFLRDAEQEFRWEEDGYFFDVAEITSPIAGVRQRLEEYITTPERLFDFGEAALLLRLEEQLDRALSSCADDWEVMYGTLGSAQELIRYLRTTADPASRTELLAPLVKSETSLYVPFAETASAVLHRLGPDPREWHALGPRRFEELLAEIWSGLGWETFLTPPTSDGGLDIRAIRNDEGICLCYLIEAKAYDPVRPVGVELVRTLYGVVERERATHGVLATTSRFTVGAIAEARALRYRVSLADFQKVLDWTREYRRRTRP